MSVYYQCITSVLSDADISNQSDVSVMSVCCKCIVRNLFSQPSHDNHDRKIIARHKSLTCDFLAIKSASMSRTGVTVYFQNRNDQF